MALGAMPVYISQNLLFISRENLHQQKRDLALASWMNTELGKGWVEQEYLQFIFVGGAP